MTASEKDSHPTYNDLKEYFETLWMERKQNIELRFEANSDRLDATAKVLEHRLEVLNHAHEKAVQDRVDFVSAKEYKTKMKDLGVWKEKVNRDITTLQTRSVTWTVALGIIFVIIQIVLKYFEFYKATH